VNLERLFGKPEQGSVGDRPVWRWSAQLEEFGESDSRPSVFFATADKDQVLICNDGDTLAAMLRRLRDPRATDASERFGNVSPVFWAHRKYRHNTTAREAAALTDISPWTESLTLAVDDKAKYAVLHLTSPQGAHDLPLGPDPFSFRPIDSRTIAATIVLSGEDGSLEKLSIALYLLGFGIYV